VKLQYYVTFCLLQQYKVVVIQTSGEVDDSNTHCSTVICASTCQILWNFLKQLL